jgi:hypothetical protein
MTTKKEKMTDPSEKTTAADGSTDAKPRKLVYVSSLLDSSLTLQLSAKKLPNGVINAETLTLAPGLNGIDAEKWARVASWPLLQARISKGFLSVQDNANVSPQLADKVRLKQRGGSAIADFLTRGSAAASLPIHGALELLDAETIGSMDRERDIFATAD